MVEFVVILPIFVGLVFAAIAFGITLNDYIRVTDIARVAARDAAIARFSGQPDPCAAAKAAANDAAGGLTLTQDPQCTYPNITRNPGDPVSVTVTVNSENSLTSIPGLSLLPLPSTLSSTATEVLQ
jgi:Flp pilus assembly protein TadG